jgi:hypothetical protein
MSELCDLEDARVSAEERARLRDWARKRYILSSVDELLVSAEEPARLRESMSKQTTARLQCLVEIAVDVLAERACAPDQVSSGDDQTINKKLRKY